MKRNRDADTDNVVYVNGPDEAKQNNNRISERVRKQKRIMFLLIVGCLAVIGIVVVAILNREYKGYRIVEQNETNYESTAAYIEFAGNLLKYTPDGVSYINNNGDTVWSAGVDMMMPMAVTSGNYAVLADMSGNTVYVFNTDGQVSSLMMPYKICDVDVANQGAFAVVLESDKTNYINLYNKNGDIIYEMQTTIDKSGYPLDITISDDGQKLFTSYININGGAVRDSLAAYNFGDVGQNSNADRMVGGYMFDNQVIPKVEFIDNDTVVAFGTNTVSVYSMKEKPAERARLTFDNELRSVFYSSEYIGVIQNNEEGSEHPYKIKVYDLHGKNMFTDVIDFQYDNIYAAEKEIIVTGENSCKIFRTNGSIKFSGTLSGKITSMVPSGKRLEYVVVYTDSTETIKLKAEAGAVEQTDSPETGAEDSKNEMTGDGSGSGVDTGTVQGYPPAATGTDAQDK